MYKNVSLCVGPGVDGGLAAFPGGKQSGTMLL
jgi:hypothetical protein